MNQRLKSGSKHESQKDESHCDSCFDILYT